MWRRSSVHGAVVAWGEYWSSAPENTSDLCRDRVDAIGFDFVIAEERHRFDECAAYARLSGDAGIDIEYSDDAVAGSPMRAPTRMPPHPRSCAIAALWHRVIRRTCSIVACHTSWLASARHPAVRGGWLIR